MLQGQEILVILLVALVVLGPQRLPEIARKLGNWTAELRRAARDIRAGLEAEVADVKQVREELAQPLKEVNQTMTDARQMMDRAAGPAKWTGPEPTQGPTSADAMDDLARIERTGQAQTDQPPTPESAAPAAVDEPGSSQGQDADRGSDLRPPPDGEGG